MYYVPCSLHQFSITIIYRWAALGPKSYLLEYADEDGQLKTKVKCKGVTLTENSALTPQAMVDLVVDGQENGRIVTDDPNLIRRDLKNLRVHVKDAARKTIRVTSNAKRYFLPGDIDDPDKTIDSVPFGFRNQ